MEKEKKNPPKLELRPNESIQVKLLRDKCYEGKNTYGPFYLYSVSHDGVEKSFFAPSEIHQQIQQLGLKSGAEFILRSEATQNSKKGNGELVLVLLGQDQPPVHSNGHADNFKAIMQQSLQDAIDITKSVNTIPFQNEDIRAISSCLFIARTKQYG